MAAPTGCYKCGRPGHWSRDCPDSSSAPNPPLSSSNSDPNARSNTSSFKPPKPVEKPKKLPRTRPKLTPETLLGEDGLGYVLLHFPRHFKYRGRGREVADLGNLIRMYSQWHSRLLPYYSFDQFVHKVEQVAATKRVKTCLRDLRERVASGVDPTKLHEPATEHVEPILHEDNSALDEAAGLHDEGGPSVWNNEVDVMQEDMIHDIFNNATQEPSQSLQNGLEKSTENNTASSSNDVGLTDEQKARAEANRLKALERAARASLSSECQLSDEQRARIDANRQKALERAAARARILQQDKCPS